MALEMQSFMSGQAAVKCDGDPAHYQTTMRWTNNIGPMYVRYGSLWLGADGHAVGDLSFWLYNETRGMIFDVMNDDHYQDRNGMENNRAKFDFRPYYMLIRPGDVMALYLCAAGPYYNTAVFDVGAYYILYYTTAEE